MADRWAVANGNWSSTATWNGGTLPAAGDDIYADGKTVAIDIDVTCLTLRITQRSGGTAGGGFTIGAGRILTITSATQGTYWHTSGTNLVTVTGSCTINCTKLVGCTTGTMTSVSIFRVTAGTLTFFGSGEGGGCAIVVAGGSLIYNGNYANCTYNDQGWIGRLSGGDVTINGNCVQNLAASGGNGSCLYMTGGNLTVNGDVTHVQGCAYVRLFSGATMTFTGSITNTLVGGNVAQSCFHMDGTCNLTITSSSQLKSGTGNSCVYVTANGVGIIDLGLSDMVALAGTAIPPVHSLNGAGTGYVIFGGSITDSPTGVSGLNARYRRTRPQTNTRTTYCNQVGYPSGSPIIHASPDVVADTPAANNVRAGISYANSASVGIMTVPAPANVRLGVPVDNTVGAAALTPADVWDYALANILTNGSIGKRLTQAATVSTTGEQLEAMESV